MAKDLFDVYSGLGTDRQRHLMSCYKILNSLSGINNLINLYKSNLVYLVLFHDIGYSSVINKLNFHPIDGAVYLRDKSLNESIVCAVANHSNAKKLCDNKLANIYDSDYFIDSELKAHFLDVIDLIDSHVDNCGEVVTVKERYLNILSRYGENSIQSISFESSLNRIKKLEEKFKWDLL